ncbi:MAG: glycosyltransferase family 2 protein [Bacteroidales bacterium]|nr:glycosyltransferase family 2 protein [Bacteroidales bacterium]
MKISIITATYNSAGTLRNTIESLLSQTYHDIEHIIVDGNSKDNTMDIIREFEPRYSGKLKYISEPDNGLYDAMNKGIALATGDVVGILNSDDFYSSNDILQNVADEIANVDAVYGDIHYVNDSDLTKIVRYYSSANFYPERMKMGFMPAHPSFYCKRENYSKYGLFDTSFRIAADFEQLLRLLYIKRIKTKYIARDFVTMRMGGASTSGFHSHKQIYSEHMRAYRKNGVRGNVFLEAIRYAHKIGEVLKLKFNL